ncbi:unnamed protein product, partial [Brachionus calyciflorus]
METESTVNSTFETTTTKNYTLDSLSRNFVNSTSLIIEQNSIIIPNDSDQQLQANFRSDLNSNEIKTYENCIVVDKNGKFIPIESNFSQVDSNQISKTLVLNSTISSTTTNSFKPTENNNSTQNLDTNESNNNNLTTLNTNNNGNTTLNGSGGRFLAIRNWLKQNRWRKKDKNQNSTSPLVIQELQTSSPKDREYTTSPLQTSSLDKKAMKKNPKNSKNKFKKLNSDYDLNSELKNNTDQSVIANITSVNTNTLQISSSKTNFENNTPLKNLTNNNKLNLINTQTNGSNNGSNGLTLNDDTPKSHKIFTPLTNGSICSTSVNFSNEQNGNFINTNSVYVNCSSFNNSPITNNNSNASPLIANPRKTPNSTGLIRRQPFKTRLETTLPFAEKYRTYENIHPDEYSDDDGGDNLEDENLATKTPQNKMKTINLSLNHQSDETKIKNFENNEPDSSPLNRTAPIPTKPRTIITLPHLIGRPNRSSQTQTNQNQKNPIIIRERIETPINSRSTFSSNNTSIVNTTIPIQFKSKSAESIVDNSPVKRQSPPKLDNMISPIKNSPPNKISNIYITGENNNNSNNISENLPSVQERIEQFQQISRQRQLVNSNPSPQNFKPQTMFNKFNNPSNLTNEKESPRVIKIFNNTPSNNPSPQVQPESPKNTLKINQNAKLNFLNSFGTVEKPKDLTDSQIQKSQFMNNLDNFLFNNMQQMGNVVDKRLSAESDVNKNIQEIPAKEPDLNKQPKKSALKNKEPDNIQYNNSQDSEDDSSNEHDTRLNPLAIKVQRNNSLARFLKDRPQLQELHDKNILHKSTDEQRKVEREEIEIKLDRKLSLRPTPKELEERNILHLKTQEEINREKEETKKMLVRKLSYRPTIQELKDKRIIRFCDYIEMSEVEDYDRRADKPWTRLTPKDKALIRNELNLYKSTEMEVHEE